MAIDPMSETVVPFAEAARHLPRLRAGRPVSPATLWRWSSHGLRGVRLETVRVGGTTCTSTEALSRFFARLAGDPVCAASPPAPAPGRVEAALDSIGI